MVVSAGGGGFDVCVCIIVAVVNYMLTYDSVIPGSCLGLMIIVKTLNMNLCNVVGNLDAPSAARRATDPRGWGVISRPGGVRA